MIKKTITLLTLCSIFSATYGLTPGTLQKKALNRDIKQSRQNLSVPRNAENTNFTGTWVGTCNNSVDTYEDSLEIYQDEYLINFNSSERKHGNLLGQVETRVYSNEWSTSAEISYSKWDVSGQKLTLKTSDTWLPYGTGDEMKADEETVLELVDGKLHYTETYSGIFEQDSLNCTLEKQEQDNQEGQEEQEGQETE